MRKTVLTSFFFFVTLPAGGAQSAGTYVLWNKGPVREISLSGATVAHKSSSSAIVGNQAAIVGQEHAVNGSFDFGEPQDSTIAVRNASIAGYRYLIFGASGLVFNRVGLGFGAEQVRFLVRGKPGAPASELSDSVVELSLSSALRVTENLAVSAALVRAVSKREIKAQTTFQTSESGSATKIGLNYRMNPFLRVGATHKTPTVMKGDATGARFESSYIPQVTQAGFQWSTHEETDKTQGFFPVGFTLSAQLDVLSFTGAHSDLVYVPADVFEDEGKKYLDTNQKTIPKFGFETSIVRDNLLEVIGYSGLYTEPVYIKGQDPRTHFSGGVTVRFWFVTFNVGADLASGYFNKNVGLGISYSNF